MNPNGTDIIPNLLGIAGTYGITNYTTPNSYDRITDYIGTKKPSTIGGRLYHNVEANGWTHGNNLWGYSNYVKDNVAGSGIKNFIFYDSDGDETECLPSAVSVSFHLDHSKKIPISVAPVECPPAPCTFEISNITDTEDGGTFDLSIVLDSLYSYGTSGFVRAMEAEISGVILAKDDAIVATTFDEYKNDTTKSDEERAMWAELSSQSLTILSNIGDEFEETRNKIMFADLLTNTGFELEEYANTTLKFTITYTERFTDFVYVSSAFFYDSTTDLNEFFGVVCVPVTPTPSPTVTPSPTITPTPTSSPTVTPSPTLCFEDAICIDDFGGNFKLHGNYHLVQEESDPSIGVVYIAVETETSGSYNPSTQTPIKIKQIGGYASHVWRIEKTDDKELWFSSTEFSEEYLNKYLYFYDESLNPIHCIRDLKRIDYTGGSGSVEITNFGYTNNKPFVTIDQHSGLAPYDINSNNNSASKYIILEGGILMSAGMSNYTWDFYTGSYTDWFNGLTQGPIAKWGRGIHGYGNYLYGTYFNLERETYNRVSFKGCNPDGLKGGMGGYDNLYLQLDDIWAGGIDYRDYTYSTSILRKIGINNAEKARMCCVNYGMLVQTTSGDVLGTGHYKTNILNSFTKIDDLQGCDIDKLVSTMVVYKSDENTEYSFAFAYIDGENDSELIYYIPTIKILSNEEYDSNIGSLAGYQLNIPFTSDYKIYRTGFTEVEDIIQIQDRLILVKTKNGKLHIHGTLNKIEKMILLIKQKIITHMKI